MRKGQVSAASVAFLILFGFILLGFIFYLSTTIKENSAEQLSDYITDSIYARLENKFGETYDLLMFNNSQAPQPYYIYQRIDIPKAIGEEPYRIVAPTGMELKIRSLGKQAINKDYLMQFLRWKYGVQGGTISSTSGYALLNFTFENLATKDILHISFEE